MSSKCTYDPRETAGHAIGMYHCPECGQMVLAGQPHPDYSVLDDDETLQKDLARLTAPRRPTMRVAELTVSITYDENKTDADAVAEALSALLERALSTDDVLDRVGNPTVSDFSVQHSEAVSDGHRDEPQ